MKHPKRTVRLEPVDKALNALGVIGLVLLLALPAYYYPSLPETIPRHFDAAGQPDAYSSKAVIWVLPAVGTLLFLGLQWLCRYPHTFNYNVPITEQNAEAQYRIATRMIRSLAAVITCTFAYIAYATIQVALGQQSGLGGFFTPVFLVVLFGVIGYFIWRSWRAA